MANFEITVNISQDPPSGPPPIRQVTEGLSHWSWQSSGFSGGSKARDNTLSPQHVKDATETYVTQIPMVFPREPDLIQPEGEQVQREPDLIQPEGEQVQREPDLIQPKEEPISVEELPQPEGKQTQKEPDLIQPEGEQTQKEPDLIQPEGEQVQKEPDLIQPEGEPSGGGKSQGQQTTPTKSGGGGGSTPPRKAPEGAPGGKPSQPSTPQSSESPLGKTGTSLDFGSIPDTIWFAALATGAKDPLSFNKGYHLDGGTNFGWDEVGVGCGVGTVLGMDMSGVFSSNSYAPNTIQIGPGSYSKASKTGVLQIDLTKNNQGLKTDPDSYVPPRMCDGPAIFPTGNALVGVAVVSTLAVNGPTVGVPSGWMTIDKFTHGKIVGTLAIGHIPPGATTITFTCSGAGCVSLIACFQRKYSVPYQNLRTQGDVSVPFVPKSVSIAITPLNPGNWPATTLPQKLAYAEQILKPKMC